MKIIRIRYLGGPNIYHNRPVCVLTLDLGSLAEVSSKDLEGFIPRLLALLPGLQEHHCSPGHVGGFVERLHRGTYFAHIVEHIALELSTSTGIGVTYGKSIYGGSLGVYQVIVRAKSERGMAEVLKIAVRTAEALANNEQVDLAPALDRVRSLVRRTEFGPSTRALVDAASARGIPITRLNDRSLVQLGYGQYAKTIEATVTSETSAIAVSTVKDKELTKALLRRVSIPVPKGEAVSTLEGALEVMQEIGGPVAVKPVDGNHGRAVCLGVTTGEQMTSAFTAARAHSSYVLVEELYRGNDYRVLVVGGKLVAAALRTPAHVTGDGSSTIAQLVALENADSQRGEGHEKALTQIDLGEQTVVCLARQNLNLASVPAVGQKIYLSDAANLSTGGTSEDVTDRVHPETARLCERAARTVGLDVCGVDLIADDIAQPLATTGNGIIELNAGPGLRMHLHPSHGQRREVGDAIIEKLYPPGAPSRIPIVAVTGTNGKTTVTRLIAHVLHHAGWRVGSTTTGGIRIGEHEVVRGDTTGPGSARTVLCDPGVQIAVLETARGGIVRRGLGYDYSDVGVVTNIAADHLGQDGIESVDDIIRIKTLVPERVRAGGTVVLNADCPNVARMMENPRLARTARRYVYFTLDPQNAFVRNHTAQGGKAYVCRGSQILEVEKGVETLLLDAVDCPLSMKGAASFQLANLMAAAAACRAQNVTIEHLQKAFRSFDPVQHNPGRLNAYRVGRGFAVVDYGHNPGAFAAICEMVRSWKGRRSSLVFSLPGDRTDALLAESARILAEVFDQVYLRQDRDLRGRPAGSATAVIRAAMEDVSADIVCHEIPDELEAVRTAVGRLEPDEVLVVIYDSDPGRVSRLLIELGALPIDQVPPAKVAAFVDPSAQISVSTAAQAGMRH